MKIPMQIKIQLQATESADCNIFQQKTLFLGILTRQTKQCTAKIHNFARSREHCLGFFMLDFQEFSLSFLLKHVNDQMKF